MSGALEGESSDCLADCRPDGDSRSDDVDLIVLSTGSGSTLFLSPQRHSFDHSKRSMSHTIAMRLRGGGTGKSIV